MSGRSAGRHRGGGRGPQAITFPRLGTATIVFRTVFESLGVPVIMCPEVSAETISLGVRHSPECACFPLKVNIGNYLEAAKLGARAAVMIGGIGPCRLGYYAEVQRAILRDLGVDLELMVLEPPSRGWRQLGAEANRISGGRSWRDIARALRLAWIKLGYVDGLTALSHHLRPREVRRGQVSEKMRSVYSWLDEAMTEADIREAGEAGLAALSGVPLRDDVSPVRVGVVGEVYMVWESSVNQNCIESLGHLGCEVEQTVWFSHWIRNNLPLGPWRARGEGSEAHYRRMAGPYLNASVGGEGQPNVGHTIDLARRGYHGVVHLAPFTCMPEIVARTVLDVVSRDYALPVLSFFLDEHAGEAGMQTRLEAFCDLLSRRRQGVALEMPAVTGAVAAQGCELDG